jgi:Holliday junction DNA helicase RuvA
MKRPPQLLLEVQGVGYELEAPMTTFYDLPDSGQEIALFTHQIVREDSVNLYGFGRVEERDVFRSLLKVNGVGAKVALAVLSGMDAGALARCVTEGDTAALSRIPGIGKKTAERLVIELRDRLGGAGAGGVPLVAIDGGGGLDSIAEAVAALVALGFKAPEASQRVRAVEGPGLECEQLVRLALQQVGR